MIDRYRDKTNGGDLRGPYDSEHPGDVFGRRTQKYILDYASVEYRAPIPKPRRSVPYLGDHMEPVSISANIAYNNTAKPQRIAVRIPYSPRGYTAERVGERFETELTVPAFSYLALQPDSPR